MCARQGIHPPTKEIVEPNGSILDALTTYGTHTNHILFANDSQSRKRKKSEAPAIDRSVQFHFSDDVGLLYGYVIVNMLQSLQRLSQLNILNLHNLLLFDSPAQLLDLVIS